MSSRSLSKGFTIFELIVSVTIMVIISSIIAGSQSQYTSGASLKNVANDLSLSLRQAQVYGISVREITPGSETFTAGYGVAFNLAPEPVGDAESFIFFADRDLDGVYDDTWDCPISASSECLDETVLSSGNAVIDLCVTVSGTEDCSIERLDVSFKRPAIEARISWDGGATGATRARIVLGSPAGKEYSVSIYTTGQISVQ